MMRRLTTGTVLMALAIVTVEQASTVAATPEPTAVAGEEGSQVVDVPGFGAYFKLPEIWEVRVSPWAAERLWPGSDFRAAAMIFSEDPASGASCMLWPYASHAAPARPSLADETSGLVTDLRATEWINTAPEFTDPEEVQLPSGQAMRFDGVQPGRIVTRYLMTDGDSLYQLACSAADPPADGWLSVAETFAFAPDVTPVVSHDPVALVDREAGFGIEVPWHWTVGGGENDIVALVVYDVDDPSDWCQVMVIDGPDGTQIGAEQYARLFLIPNLTEAGFGWDVDWLDLPAGRALRVDGTPGDTTEQRWISAFFLEHDRRLSELLCTGTRAPDGRWLSVADTFEFIPEGE